MGSICTQICGENSVKRMGKTGLEISKILTPKQVTRPPIYRPEKYSRWDLSELPVDRPGRPPTVKNPTVGATGRPTRSTQKNREQSLNSSRPPRSPGTLPDQTCTSVHVGRPTRSTDFRVSRLIS